MPHLDAVFRAAVAICGQTLLAEDLTQTTYLKAVDSFDTFRPGTRCKAWLLQILRNTWIDYLRKQNSIHEEPCADDGQVPARPEHEQTAWSDAQDLLGNFSDEQVIAALGKLPDEQRLTLFLIDVEGISGHEVAQITGVPEGTVKSRTNRARLALKQSLQTHARELGFVGRR